MKLRIASLRSAHALTQLNVATALGVSKNYYAQIERGEKPARQIYLEKLASLYNCPLTELYQADAVPPRLQAAIDTLRRNFNGIDLSDDMSELMSLIGGLNLKGVAELKAHAQLLLAVNRA
jgi:transcriptional regulator with XRE-family HTH domain